MSGEIKKRKQEDGRPLKISDEEIEEKLYKCLGNISMTARTVDMSRQWLKERIDRSPRLTFVLKDAREAIIDIAEIKLVSAIESGEPWAVAMVLKTIGKSRGYSEKIEQEITGSVGVTIIDDVGGRRDQ